MRSGWPLPSGKQYTLGLGVPAENLLREVRRQRRHPERLPYRAYACSILTATSYGIAGPGGGHRHPGWACYHTDMWELVSHRH